MGPKHVDAWSEVHNMCVFCWFLFDETLKRWFLILTRRRVITQKEDNLNTVNHSESLKLNKLCLPERLTLPLHIKNRVQNSHPTFKLRLQLAFLMRGLCQANISSTQWQLARAI
jgi:hypothetical protein